MDADENGLRNLRSCPMLGSLRFAFSLFFRFLGFGARDEPGGVGFGGEDFISAYCRRPTGSYRCSWGGKSLIMREILFELPRDRKPAKADSEGNRPQRVFLSGVFAFQLLGHREAKARVTE